MTSSLPIRRPNFTNGRRWDELDAVDLRNWTPKAPELTCVANAVSLSMPFVEPFVVASVRAVVDDLHGALADEARAYCGQEAAHHGQHRRYNDALRSVSPSVRRLEQWNKWAYEKLSARSIEFRVAYAAGFETVAFAVARWFDPRIDRLFLGANPGPARMFLWHLAEEVEHKGIAFDVARACGVTRRTFAFASILAFFALGASTLVGVVIGLVTQRRWWNPLAWLRLIWWSVSFLMVALPLIGLSMFRDHHPSQLVDPTTLPWLLSQYRDDTFPIWDTAAAMA